YSHLIASLALCEAVNQSNQTTAAGGCPSATTTGSSPCSLDPQALRAAAQKSVDFTIKGAMKFNTPTSPRCRYAPNYWDSNGADLTFHAWGITNVLTAKIAGLDISTIEPNILSEALTWLTDVDKFGNSVQDYGVSMGDYAYCPWNSIFYTKS